MTKQVFPVDQQHILLEGFLQADGQVCSDGGCASTALGAEHSIGSPDFFRSLFVGLTGGMSLVALFELQDTFDGDDEFICREGVFDESPCTG